MACVAENLNSLVGFVASGKISATDNPENPAANKAPSVPFKKVLLFVSTLISPHFLLKHVQMA
jgi:hypothetical protein